MATVGVADLADAGMVAVVVADLADAGMAFPADFAGVVTVGVAPLADARVVTVGVTGLADAGVASLVDAGMAFPADPAGVVTIGVASLANAELATVGVTDLADDGVWLHAAPVAVVNGPEHRADVICWGDQTSPGVWSRTETKVEMEAESQHIDCVCCVPMGRDCSVPAVGRSGSFGTCLPDLPCLVADDMTCWERLEALGDDSYYCYGQSDSFDYDDPQDYEEWCAWNDVDEEEGYYAPFSLLLLLRLSGKREMRIFQFRTHWNQTCRTRRTQTHPTWSSESCWVSRII